MDGSTRKTRLDVSETKVPEQFELDGIHDDEVDDSYHGQFTRNDRRDMGRMGKVQELRVRIMTSNQVTRLTISLRRGIFVPSPP